MAISLEIISEPVEEDPLEEELLVYTGWELFMRFSKNLCSSGEPFAKRSPAKSVRMINEKISFFIPANILLFVPLVFQMIEPHKKNIKRSSSRKGVPVFVKRVLKVL
ncbi:MAG: hypothetical protein J5599_01210 [Spirochaetales bacterium]|nr:hypothetical protein [Spirochaetales bacterium]